VKRGRRCDRDAAAAAAQPPPLRCCAIRWRVCSVSSEIVAILEKSAEIDVKLGNRKDTLQRMSGFIEGVQVGLPSPRRRPGRPLSPARISPAIPACAAHVAWITGRRD
jgi:hypothetical protein